jgi:predicted  nucleic acid-binding Zn-ribbon protein
MVHFLYPQFRGNPADREHRLIFDGETPNPDPTPIEAKPEAGPVAPESADAGPVAARAESAVDATSTEVDSTPAPEGVVAPLVVEGTNGKTVGVKIAEGLPGNEGKTKTDFDKAQLKKGETEEVSTDKAAEGAADSAKETVEPVVAEVTQEQMKSVAYQSLGLSGIPDGDVYMSFGPGNRDADVYDAEGTLLGKVTFDVDGEVSSATPNEEGINTVKAKIEAKDKADKAAEEKGEKPSDDPEMDRLGKEVDQGVKDLEAAKTPAQALAALGKILSAIIEMVKRTLGIQTEADKQEGKSTGERGAESSADTSTESGLRAELKDRGATSIEDQREELADLRDQAQEKVEKNKEEISELDTEIDGLQTKKESVDDQVQALKKQLIDAEQEGKSEEDLSKMKGDLRKLERKAERIQTKIDKALDRRRELVDQNKKLEASIAAIDKLESRLDTLESTFDKIEQALEKKFGVKVNMTRDNGQTVINIDSFSETTPKWFQEFVTEHDANDNPEDGYQLDVGNAELLSKMPASKPKDSTEKPAESGTETDETTSETGEKEPVDAEVTNETLEDLAYSDLGLDGIPKGDVTVILSEDRRSADVFHSEGAKLGTVEFAVDGEVSGTTPDQKVIDATKEKYKEAEEVEDKGTEDGSEKTVDQLVQDFTTSGAILRDALQTGGDPQAALDQLNPIAAQAREAGGDDVADVNDMLVSALENELGSDAEKVVMQEDGKLVLKPEPTETPEPTTPPTEEVAKAPDAAPAEEPPAEPTAAPAEDPTASAPAEEPTPEPTDDAEAAPAEDPTASENTPDATPAGTEIGNERLLELTRWAENIQANADKAGYNVMVSLDQQNGTLLIQETDGSAETDMPKILAFAQAHELVPQSTDFGDSAPPARQITLNVTGKLDGLGYYGGENIDSVDTPRAKQIEAAKTKVAEEMQQADPVADDLNATA